jgi:hypothetical protein
MTCSAAWNLGLPSFPIQPGWVNTFGLDYQKYSIYRSLNISAERYLTTLPGLVSLPTRWLQWSLLYRSVDNNRNSSRSWLYCKSTG